jgi:crossover junction endodeoxyribonuclease RuvC
VIVLGIDPGLSGAIAFLPHNGMPDVVDLPTVPTEESGPIARRIHGLGLKSLLRERCPPSEPVLVVMEALATGGQGRGNAASVGSQFDTHATIRTVCELLGLKPRKVSPQSWKSFYGIKGEGNTPQERSRDLKEKSLAMARELYPACAHQLRLAKSHNKAEALLIARWGKQNLA